MSFAKKLMPPETETSDQSEVLDALAQARDDLALCRVRMEATHRRVLAGLDGASALHVAQYELHAADKRLQALEAET